ncbi:MAG TPA: CHAD domain-containing protein [Microbacterium sp.]|uniref:CHAD domain-containing protein n=1 Tax=Microbacterium sp. TaxID=51671 RepID=UPI002C60914D|nr:CHAD domain-containing protein [Microbacterium sp.]HWI31051.1 CHAD domain-containing protein [Microbacterium sp.]
MADPTAGAIVTRTLEGLAAKFDETEQRMLRGDDPEGTHDHRTTVRRVRSVLAAYRGLFDSAAVKRLRSELKVWGGVLGVVRDIEVGADLAEAAIDSADGQAGAPVRRRLVEQEREAAERARGRAVVVHDGERARETRRLLKDFAADPPRAAAADEPAERLRKAIRRELRRTERAALALDGSLARLHALRKAARRLRYAVEGPMDDPSAPFGRKIARVGERAHAIQRLLGDHRDAALLAERVDRAAALAARDGEDVTDYERLAGIAVTDADAALAGLDRALARLRSAARKLG